MKNFNLNNAIAATSLVLLPSCLYLNKIAFAESTQPSNRIVVQTNNGSISSADPSKSSKNITSFKGIPFAQPPVADLRWQDPKPAASWKGIRSGDNYGKACIQPPTRFDVLQVGEQSEDCLYLNVWSPSAALASDAVKRPVLFFIHGGAFTSGAGHIYPGEKLAEQDIVVVSFNYRLGNFGFLTHKGLNASSVDGVGGNYGLLDQALALKWVRENISKFGGDPNQITIDGQSAGASSVAYMMVSPMTRGMFKGAILQSGYPSSETKDLASAERSGSSYATKMQCLDEATAIQCLRSKKSSEILSSMSIHTFSPIVDGTYIPDSPKAMFEKGQQAQVPLLVSQTKDEAYMFTKQTPILLNVQYKFTLKQMFQDFSDEVYDAFPPANFASLSDAFAAVATASYYSAPVRKFMRTLSSTHNKPAYQLYFTRLSENANTYKMGVFHGVDLFYLFNWTEGREGFDSIDKTVESAMQTAFASFVKSGDPENEALRRLAGYANNPGKLWPAFTYNNEEYLEFGDKIKSGSNICETSKASCDLFDKIEGSR